MPYFTPNEHSLLGSLFAGRQTALSRVQAISFSPPCGLGGGGCPSSIKARCLSTFCLTDAAPALGGWKTQREVKEGENQLLLSLCLCWIPVSASRGQGSTCSELRVCVIWSVASVRASPAKVSSSGDGARVREGEKAAVLCKPVPMAAEPVGSHVAMPEASEWLFPGGRSQPLPDPAPQRQRGFCWWVKGGKSRYPKPSKVPTWWMGSLSLCI